MITACSHCGSKYELPDKMLGRQARCKACSKMFLISFLADDAMPVPEVEPTHKTGQAPPTKRTSSTGTRRPAAPQQTHAAPEPPEHDDPLNALASAATGDQPPPPRPASRQPAGDPRAAYDQDRPVRSRKAKGAGAAMGTGIAALVLAVAAGVCGLITMLSGDNEALITALVSTTIILAIIATALAMIAVVNGTSATSRIRRARHPLSGRSQASTGSITGAIALLLVVALVLAGSIWLINRGGLNFQEVVTEGAE